MKYLPLILVALAAGCSGAQQSLPTAAASQALAQPDAARCVKQWALVTSAQIDGGTLYTMNLTLGNAKSVKVRNYLKNSAVNVYDNSTGQGTPVLTVAPGANQAANIHPTHAISVQQVTPENDPHQKGVRIRANSCKV